VTNEEYLELIRQTWQPEYHDHVLYAMVGLAGEAGEIANLAQKGMRGDYMPKMLCYSLMFTSNEDVRKHVDKRQQLIEEMGGVFYFLHALCWQLDVDPEAVMRINAEKLRSRLERGTIRGDGDDR
jgi:NTP pyrophosphatase (non-canonical NTP hydrolase)